jgi:hypothetical protein
MKKKLLQEILRQKLLMGILSESQLLKEDGILSNLAYLLKKTFSNATPETGRLGQVTGKKIGNTTIPNSEFDDLSRFVSDFENKINSGARLTDDQFRYLNGIIISDDNLRNAIYRDIMSELMSNTDTKTDRDMIMKIRNVAGNTDREIMDYLNREVTPNLGINNTPEMQLIYDVFVREIVSKINKIDIEGDLNSVIDWSNDLTNPNRWAKLNSQFTAEDKKFLNNELNPSIVESIMKAFKSFDNDGEFEKFQKYLKIYENSNDVTQKLQIKKFLTKKYAQFFNDKRELYEKLTSWVDSVIKKYPNTTQQTKQMLENFRKLVDNQDFAAIGLLRSSNSNIDALLKRFSTVVELSFTPIKKLKFWKIYEDKLDESGKKVLQPWVQNFKRWLISGSAKGFPTKQNQLWLQYTGGNLSKAKKLYLSELFGRYLKLNLVWGTLTFLIERLNYLIVSDEDIKSCNTNLLNKISQDSDFKLKMENGTLTHSELPEPCNKSMVLWATIHYQKGGWKNAIVEDLLPSFNFDSFTDIFPGKIDDLLQNVVSGLDWSDNIDNLSDLRRGLEEQLKTVEQEIDDEAGRITNNLSSEKYKNDLNGFKSFLKDNSIDDSKVEGTKDTFIWDKEITWKFIDSDKNGLGTFESND